MERYFDGFEFESLLWIGVTLAVFHVFVPILPREPGNKATQIHRSHLSLESSFVAVLPPILFAFH